MKIEHDMNTVKVIDDSKWCNLVLHGNNRSKNWNKNHFARIWYEEEDNDHQVVDMFALIFDNGEAGMPISFVELPVDNFEAINIIFHSGSLPTGSIRKVFCPLL
jgi:hypothetical protein